MKSSLITYFSFHPINKQIYIVLYIKYDYSSVPEVGLPNQGLRSLCKRLLGTKKKTQRGVLLKSCQKQLGAISKDCNEFYSVLLVI